MSALCLTSVSRQDLAATMNDSRDDWTVQCTHGNCWWPYGMAAFTCTARHDCKCGIADSPAAIKLMAGCVWQLQQAAQMQQPSSLLPRCKCDVCHSVQTFLTGAEDVQSFKQTEAQAQHAVQ